MAQRTFPPSREPTEPARLSGNLSKHTAAVNRQADRQADRRDRR